MNLGLELKNARLSQKIKTQVHWAKKIGISQTSLSQIESGKYSPSDKHLAKMCKLYGIPLPILIWNSMTSKDVEPNKRGAFESLRPHLDNLISEYFPKNK